jgi:DNA-binding CsgD family transcriptional regulator
LFILVLVSTAILLLCVILFCAPKSKSKTNLWYAAFLFTAGLGYPVSMLRYYIIPAINNNKTLTLFSQLLSAVSFRFAPYFLLLAGISYSDFMNEHLKGKVKSLLLIPVVLTFIVDFIFPDIGFIRQHIYEHSWFWLTAIWAVPYGVLGNAFFFKAYYSETSPKRKRRKLAIFLITLPSLGNILIVYGTPLLKLSGWQMWCIGLLPAGIGLTLFLLILLKADVMGVQIKIAKVDFYEEEKEELISKANLTKTERNILDYVLEGLTTREIAEAEGKAQQTVKNQLHSIYLKMEVKGRGELLEKVKIEGVDPE